MGTNVWYKNIVENWREKLLLALKLSVGCVLSIVIAYELGVRYSPTAGVITVLSIQKYKLETIQTAWKRLLAFCLALLIAGVSFSTLGFTSLGFGVFLFVFVFLCISLEWEIALSISVVLITHLLEQGEMSKEVLVNEFAVFGIGAGMGILMNLHLKRNVQILHKYINGMDGEFDKILLHMAKRLGNPELDETNHGRFKRLGIQIRRAEETAWANHQNSIRFSADKYMSYIRARRQQSEVLYEMEKRMGQLDMTPVQAERIRLFLERLAGSGREKSQTESLKEELRGLFEQMRMEKLPVSREEFESRAVLFVFMLHLKELLELHEGIEGLYAD